MPTIIPSKLEEFRAYRPSDTVAQKYDEAAKLKPVDNGVAQIQFFRKEKDRVVPYIEVTPAPVEDKKKLERALEVSPEKMEALKGKPADFGPFLSETIEAKKSYLAPTKAELEVKSDYQRNHIVGQRIDDFSSEVRKLAADLYPKVEGEGPQPLDEALKAANKILRRLAYDRTINFDEFQAGAYASYGHDDAFVHVLELYQKSLGKLDLGLLPDAQKENVARTQKQIQGELDAIFTQKYVYHNSDMRELDAEHAIGLVAIDRNSRARISEKPETQHSIVPTYETIKIEVDGAMKPIFFDAAQKKHFFEESHLEVSAELLASAKTERSDVAKQDIVCRRRLPGETLRKDFRWDWDKDGYVNSEPISWVGWAGHCDDKAKLEAAGCVLDESGEGVLEYDSGSGKKIHYNPDLLNEGVFLCSELGDRMADPVSKRVRNTLGKTDFAGSRDDDIPDQLLLGNGRQVPLRGRPNVFEIEKVTIDRKEYDAEDAFREHTVAEDRLSAQPNPLYRSRTDGDVVELALGQAKVEARVEFPSFDEKTGNIKQIKRRVTLDFQSPSEERLLVDALVKDAAKREIYEITLDLRENTWNYQLYRYEKPEGKDYYAKVRVEGDRMSVPFDPQQLVGRREADLDRPDEWLPFVDDTMKTGVNATAETAAGQGVWNGKMRELGKSFDAEGTDADGKNWERWGVNVDAEFGSNRGQFLIKLDELNQPAQFVPLSLPADFFWRSQMVFAPESDGLVNAKALERGLIQVENGVVHAEALGHLSELMKLAFDEKKYSILHQGERFVFDKKEDFEAEVAKLKGLRASVFDAPPADTAIHLEPAGSLKPDERKALDPIAITEDAMIDLVIAEGDVSIDVQIKEGADKVVDTRSISRWSDEKTLRFPVEAGRTVHIEVAGKGEGEEAKPYKLKVDSDPSLLFPPVKGYESMF